LRWERGGLSPDPHRQKRATAAMTGHDPAQPLRAYFSRNGAVRHSLSAAGPLGL